jgi:hypothetical protein
LIKNGLFLRRLVVPVGVAVGLLTISLLLATLPEPYAPILARFERLLSIAGIVWVIQRVLRYEGRLTNHEAQMLAMIDRGQQQRTKEIATLAEHQAELAAALRDERQQKHQDQQELSGKLDDVLEQGKKES